MLIEDIIPERELSKKEERDKERQRQNQSRVR